MSPRSYKTVLLRAYNDRKTNTSVRQHRHVTRNTLKRSAKTTPTLSSASHKLSYSELLYSAATVSQHRNKSAGGSVAGVLLPALVRWLLLLLLLGCRLVAVQGSVRRVLRVVLLRQASLVMVECWVSMAPILRRLLGLLRLAEGALLLTLSLVAVELGRRKC